MKTVDGSDIMFSVYRNNYPKVHVKTVLSVAKLSAEFSPWLTHLVAMHTFLL